MQPKVWKRRHELAKHRGSDKMHVFELRIRTIEKSGVTKCVEWGY